MVLEASEDQEEEGKTGHQFFHASLLQADALPDHRANLDGCSTMTAFKSKQYLSNIRTVDKGVKINCGLGALRSNQVGDYGSMNVWFIQQGIMNIFSMNELEKKYQITYNSSGGDITWYILRRGRSGSTMMKMDYRSLTSTSIRRCSCYAGADWLGRCGKCVSAEGLPELRGIHQEGNTSSEGSKAGNGDDRKPQ